MTITAKVVLDSIAPNGVRIVTTELTYPRMIHAELMTHRVFSRNAASSRAIPTPKKIERIRADIAKPSEWGINQAGMASKGPVSKELAEWAERIWNSAAVEALRHAEILCGVRCASCQFRFEAPLDSAQCNCGNGGVKLDLHKQVANRISECFDHITTVVTSTKFNNHRKLRTEVDPVTGRPMPDPTYFELATKWHAAIDQSKPCKIANGEWHLPYVSYDTNWEGEIKRVWASDEDLKSLNEWCNEKIPVDAWGKNLITYEPTLAILKKISVGRIARTSYMRQGQGDLNANIELHDRLSSAGHWSPFEPIATPITGIKLHKPFSFQCDGCLGQLTNAKGAEVDVDYNVTRVFCQKCALGHVTSGNFLGWKQYRKEFAGEAGGDD